MLFENDAIIKKRLNETLLIPAPTQIISSGKIGIINKPNLAKKYMTTIPEADPIKPIINEPKDPITALPAGIVTASGKGKRNGWKKQIKIKINFANDV